MSYTLLGTWLLIHAGIQVNMLVKVAHKNILHISHQQTM